jgi:hypothetical protein
VIFPIGFARSKAPRPVLRQRPARSSRILSGLRDALAIIFHDAA